MTLSIYVYRRQTSHSANAHMQLHDVYTARNIWLTHIHAGMQIKGNAEEKLYTYVAMEPCMHVWV